MAAPVIRAVGAQAANANAISPGLPAGTAVGDLLLMFLENSANSGANTASGWTNLPVQSPKTSGGTSSHTRLAVLYRVATGTDPTTTNDSGDHQLGQIIGIEAGTFNASSPFDGAGGGDFLATADTAVTIPGGTSTVGECLILAAASFAVVVAVSSWTNASLASITERIDIATSAGNTGTVAVASGVKTVAGVYDATTATLDVTSVQARISFAVAPFGGVTTPLTLSATQGQTPLIPRHIAKVLVA